MNACYSNEHSNWKTESEINYSSNSSSSSLFNDTSAPSGLFSVKK